MQIRTAHAADAGALAEMRWTFRTALAAPAESRDAFLARCTAWVARELGTGALWRAWVAEIDGRIVGQVWLQTIDKVPNPVGERERHAYVSNLYVTPAARGGVGTKLLETAVAWAAHNRVDRVLLWPSALSRTLYERHGFTFNGDVMELTLT